MRLKNLLRLTLIVCTVVINISCDQVSKKIVRNTISYGEDISLLNNHLTITRAENTGAFLSVGEALSPVSKKILLLALPLLAMALGFAYLVVKTTMSRLFLIGACFILGGGIGNLADRMLYGSVTDFLHLRFGMLQTGIFNMADVSIIVGSCIILLNYFRHRTNDHSQPA